MQSTSQNRYLVVSLAVSLVMCCTSCSRERGSGTPDSGWMKQASGVGSTLYSAYFLDSQIGWAVGAAGTILHTDDAGDRWQNESKGIEDWRGVHFTDQEKGWVVGASGKIMHTSDGGSTWQNQISGVSEDLLAVTFHDRDTGWGAGNSGLVLGTTDGGATWEIQESGWSVRLTAIGSFDSHHAWAYGPMSDTATVGVLFRTENSGHDWSKTFGPGNWPVSADFISLDTGWAVTELGTVASTTDGGGDWTVMSSPPLWGFGLDFRDVQKGWVVGGVGSIRPVIPEVVLIGSTEDGGENWTAQLRGSSADTLLDVMFVDAQNGWAVGTRGTIYHTSSGGR